MATHKKGRYNWLGIIAPTER